MNRADVKIWSDHRTQLVLRAGEVEFNADEQKLWFSRNTYLSVLSSINALVALRLELFSKGVLKAKLGQQVLLNTSHIGRFSETLYFVISPGDNKILFEYEGSKVFGCFEKFTELTEIYDFVVIDPKLEVLAN